MSGTVVLEQPTQPRVTLSTSNDDYGLEQVKDRPELQERRHAGWRQLAGILTVAGVGLAVLGLWGVGAQTLTFGIALSLLMAPAYAALSLLPKEGPALPPISSQHEHWAMVRTRLLFYKRVRDAGALSTWAGLGMVAAARLMAASPAAYLVGTGILTGAAGAILWGSMAVRRRDTLEMARQTALLQQLESQGLAPAGTLDPRVRRVLAALDEVLADVPDSTLARFLESEESSLYLELLAEARNE